MNAPIIGLIGRARSGKDTFAARLVTHHGYTRLAFADALKDMALEVDPYVVRSHNMVAWRLSAVVRECGWEGAKAYRDVRELLQRLAMAVRSADPDFWVRRVRTQIAINDGPIVVTDVRFRNEASMIGRHGGILVRITRPGLPEDDHVSETELAYHAVNWTLVNDGEIADLHHQADLIAEAVAPITA